MLGLAVGVAEIVGRLELVGKTDGAVEGLKDLEGLCVCMLLGLVDCKLIGWDV